MGGVTIKDGSRFFSNIIFDALTEFTEGLYGSKAKYQLYQLRLDEIHWFK